MITLGDLAANAPEEIKRLERDIPRIDDAICRLKRKKSSLEQAISVQKRIIEEWNLSVEGKI